MSGDAFWQVIAAQGLAVPEAVLALHAGQGTKQYEGRCDITRGTGLLARIVLRLAGFPPAGQRVPVRLTITTSGDHGAWVRDFGGHVTRSHLSCNSAKDRVIERFGPIRLMLSLRATEGRLHISVAGMRFFGLPVPKALLPVSDTVEGSGPNGVFQFDVAARAPGAGFLIRYTGELHPG